MQRLLAVITVGCDGRPADAVRQSLGRETLLERAGRLLMEAAPDRVVVSIPDDGLRAASLAAGGEPLVRTGRDHSLEGALTEALDALPDDYDLVLAVDPLLPLRRPGRLAAALRLAAAGQADSVFTCHRHAALLWRRSPMGLVPYFDPAERAAAPDHADELSWLREDGGFYLLDTACFRRDRSRHCGRMAPLETEPAEAIGAADAAGLAACRALIAERRREAAAAAS